MKSISRSELFSETNSGVLEYMDELSLGQGIVHPDVVERMEELRKNLEKMSLRRYKNSIIIKSDISSVVVAAAFGTAYSIKAGSMFYRAIDSGAKTSYNWSDGGSLNLIESFGRDWIVGSWEDNETDWIRSGNA